MVLPGKSGLSGKPKVDCRRELITKIMCSLTSGKAARPSGIVLENHLGNPVKLRYVILLRISSQMVVFQPTVRRASLCKDKGDALT